MASAEDDIAIARHPERQRYELTKGGQLAGFLQYAQTPGRLDLIHTEVVPAHEGHGVGSRLAKFALDEARREGLKVTATCEFVAQCVERHPEYGDLLA